MPDFLSLYAAAQPDKLAVADDRPGGPAVRRTFAELEVDSNRLAHALLGLGLGPGKKLVWCGQKSIPVVTAINAARKIGATAVPLNYRLSPEKAIYVTDHSNAIVVFVDSECASMFSDLRSGTRKFKQL